MVQAKLAHLKVKQPAHGSSLKVILTLLLDVHQFIYSDTCACVVTFIPDAYTSIKAILVISQGDDFTARIKTVAGAVHLFLQSR